MCWVRYAFQVESPATEVTILRVTAGHHSNGARHAETVIVLQPGSWRYSRNYGYLASRQRRNGPRGLHLWRRQNYAKYEISMFYGNIHANNVMRANHGNGLQQHGSTHMRLLECSQIMRLPINRLIIVGGRQTYIMSYPPQAASMRLLYMNIVLVFLFTIQCDFCAGFWFWTR